jgi:hypothetical protein
VALKELAKNPIPFRVWAEWRYYEYMEIKKPTQILAAIPPDPCM